MRDLVDRLIERMIEEGYLTLDQIEELPRATRPSSRPGEGTTPKPRRSRSGSRSPRRGSTAWPQALRNLLGRRGARASAVMTRTSSRPGRRGEPRLEALRCSATP